jgi:hypothetical protein
MNMVTKNFIGLFVGWQVDRLVVYFTMLFQ